VSDHTLDSVLSALREGMEQVYGERLVRMVLYGSRARGDAESGSDLDVLIVLAGTVDPGEEISRTGGFMRREGSFLRNVRKEGILV
jgi:predicted nucleotidyltransferase